MSEPTFFIAAGTAIISSRSGWGADDTQVLAKMGSVRESHEDRAIGEFLIYRGSWLAGQAKLLSRSGISQDCWDHNCIDCDHASQAWTEDTSRIVTQENTPEYTFIRADLTGSYPTKFSSYTRELFHLLPGYVLTRDTYAPVSLSSKVTYHLHTLAQPTIVRSTIAAGQLFGTVINPPSGIMTWVPVKLSPDQNTPTYRIDLFADTDNEIVVALEAGAANQTASTLGMPITYKGVKGITCGTATVLWLTGPGPWTYTSQGGTMTWLIGLKPGVTYHFQGATGTASAAGVLGFTSPLQGVVVTVAESGTPLPPTPPTVTSYGANPVTAGQPFTINGTGFTADATASFNGMDCAARYQSPSQLFATAPNLGNLTQAQILVRQASGSALGPPLWINPVPPPPAKQFTISGTATQQPDGSLSGTITLVPKP